jgi:hypothetical protein
VLLRFVNNPSLALLIAEPVQRIIISWFDESTTPISILGSAFFRFVWALIQYCVPKPEIVLVEAENPTKATIDFEQSWIHSRQAAHIPEGDFNWTGGCDDLGNGSNPTMMIMSVTGATARMTMGVKGRIADRPF